ncbi:hypothetical protein ACB094_03G038600 [Castanea mollissima]
MKKNVLDFNDFHASMLDRVHEFLGRRVSLQFISAVNMVTQVKNGLQGKLGEPAYLEDWITTITPLTAGKSAFKVTFDWDNEMEIPRAILKRNYHHSEFYLNSITLEDVPGQGRIHFPYNSWTYLPSETPAPLRKYRDEELVNLRDGKGELKEWDRVYDYAYYNDLGNPDKGPEHVRPVLGGSSEYPYPRRGRTGRPLTETDRNTESRLNPLLSIIIYVPRDERFGHLKMSDFVAYALKGIAHGLFENIPAEMLKEIFRTDGEGFLKYPVPQVINSAWMTDEEFAREMLAAINPVTICRLQEFPPTSKLDSKVYGYQTSAITKEYIEKYLSGLSIDEAIKSNKLFILDHHDTLMPYLSRINKTSTKIYASRTILFLNEDGTLKPLAIELSLPHPDGDQFGAISKVYTPAEEGVQNFIWQLAKSNVVVNDSGNHQLMSHWLNTHAAIETFVIATNRQLSVLHPIYKLLDPHFRDTMNVNALARQVLINANGALESTVFPSMEMSLKVYKSWVFPEQALPADLIKRGMAVKDVNSPHGLRLLIEDYPSAVDGLEIWSAIKTWVEDYCSFYYKTDDMVRDDSELQANRNMHYYIWIASALHAAINFGQYPYGGYPPNRPAMSRHFMPEEGTSDYEELKSHPEKALLKIFTSQFESVLGISLVEILSRHLSDEIFLGQRDSLDWTSDTEPIEAFKRLGKNLKEVEDRITKRNKDEKLKNRVGPVKMPYTLLCPTSEEGLTFKGIPNSVSI